MLLLTMYGCGGDIITSIDKRVNPGESITYNGVQFRSYIENLQSMEEGFGFKSTVVTKEQCIAYIDACKAKGFTIDARSVDGGYTAKNAEGYGLSILHGEYWISACIYTE